jgi:hypothetical protein
MQHTSEICSNCETENKCRRRDFSEQAWSVLVLWNEVNAGAVDQPICDDCYDELRDVLIDRANEVDNAVNAPAPKRPAAAAANKKAPAGRQKVRKAS